MHKTEEERKKKFPNDFLSIIVENETSFKLRNGICDFVYGFSFVFLEWENENSENCKRRNKKVPISEFGSFIGMK